MKSLFIPAWMLLAGFLAGAEPPEAIRAYYDRAAFVATYSTQAERSMLARANKLPQPDAKPRAGLLGKVAEAQELNAQMTLRTDPRMPLGSIGSQPSLGYVALAEIVECIVTPATVTLKVRSHQLPESAVARFKTIYNQAAGDASKLPSLAQRLVLTDSKVSPIAIHEWVLTEGGWRKKESDWLLLSR